jgi:hypothetical protein
MMEKSKVLAPPKQVVRDYMLSRFQSIEPPPDGAAIRGILKWCASAPTDDKGDSDE